MTTFVLVPGFWLGAWAWQAVAEQLRSNGHQVVALTPGGVAERAGERSVTIETRVADVVAELRGRRDAVLVGHSGAAVVVAVAAERARERLSRLVYVDTGPLPEGMSQIDFVSPQVREWTRKVIAENDGWYPMPTRTQFTEMGTSTEGIDDETFQAVHERSTPEPAGTVTGSARRGTPDSRLLKTVIACTFTEEQARGATVAGALGFTEMGDPEWSFAELPTGRWPMFSRPAELAELLVTEPAPAHAQ